MADKLDFSKFERIAPREDSWAKVCERLDAEADAVSASKFISIKSWYSAIPIAASLVLIGLTALLPAISNQAESTDIVAIDRSAPSEVLSWYSSLGNSTSDEFETFEETVGFSYLTKE